MYSYSSTIVKVILGSAKALNPIDHLDILQINQGTNSLVVKSNRIIALNNEVLDLPDNNLYELQVKNKEQFNELIKILNLTYKPATQSLDNHCTTYGQYLKFVSNGIQIDLNINVQKEKITSRLINWH